MAGQARTASPQATTLEALERAFAAGLGAGGSVGPLERSFLTQAYEDYAADETPEIDGDDLAAVLSAAWRSSAVRKPGQPASITVGPLTGRDGRATGYDNIQIVQDDGPFLVDSVLGQLADAGVSVRALFHPVVPTGRDAAGARVEGAGRESMIVVILDPLPQERRDALGEALSETLADVRAAVGDHAAMTALMERSAQTLTACPAGADPEVLAENVEFLNWLTADRFVFLGARDYEYPRSADGGYEAEAPLSQSGEGLGVLRDPERRVLRRASEPAVLTRQMQRQLDLSEPVTVAKANIRSRVHRRAYMDYIGVKRYGADGRPSGETRFVGLFTAEAYDKMAKEVPLIRRKVANALERAGKAPGSHNHKRLKNILENYPRDELFQIGEDELLNIALGILHLYDRPRIKIFSRKDPFDRFVSILAFIPRERFHTSIRERIGAILARAWGGRVSAWYPELSDQPLVRIHYIIGVNPGDHPCPDEAALEAEVAEAGRSWVDRFETALRVADFDEVAVGPLSARWAHAFGAGYRDRYDAAEAVRDLMSIDTLNADGQVGVGEPVAVRAFRASTDNALQFRFKLYRRGAPVPLSDVLPILADMGLKTLEEFGHAIRPSESDPIHIHEFLLEDPRGEALSFDAVRGPFEDAFSAVWNGRTESDGFNRLVLELGVDWREAALIRALSRYRQQTGLDPSQGVQEEALREYPTVARALLALFAAKFDPAGGPVETRETAVADLHDGLLALLQEVKSLDHDRALRRIAALILAIKRTNFYQLAADGRPHPYIAIKIASRELDDLPLPKPFREIFVWAPHVEGVHLRFGPVARGGLRWSDRRDDFRTEVLGLVKAQMVKNTVIVPVGAKGGFFCKRPPLAGDRDAIQAEGIACYKLFIQGLLDITDNIVGGKIIAPPQVVRHDQDDPYLVVAADKGTATFSDIANGLAIAHGFWLGDAFASGGSVGYDHKGMGITARGAWESVKRHFRAMGRDSQSEDFTCVGIGDMSGDVFGNGMLLSRHIRLVAAFDHRHIFLDPNPDAASSFVERDRLFKLPRSSWADYDAKLISKGGGIFPRTLKAIEITPQVREVLALDASVKSLSPNDLMNAILKAPVDLFWNGGIGTYVKASSESHADVGDRANNGLRVNGGELRCKVVGEGGNLGLTQLGRIEAAQQAGVLLNTDFIDNSAGVDTSDHEVNIKILLNAVVQDKKLTVDARNKLLASMTDEVAELVLWDNYRQNQAISLMERMSVKRLGSKQHFIRTLEQQGLLDRQIEFLPSDAELSARKARGQGLTRPELAVLLSYSKLVAFQQLLESDIPEDPYLSKELQRYFPQPLQKKYADAMEKHRLKREIIATAVTNTTINRMGATFLMRMQEDTGRSIAEVAKAYTISRETLDARSLWTQIDALDGKVPESVQIDALEVIWQLQRSFVRWLLLRPGAMPGITTAVERYHGPFNDIRVASGVLGDSQRPAYVASVQEWKDKGLPPALAQQLSELRYLEPAFDIIETARTRKLKPVEVSKVHFRLGEALQLPWLFEQIDALEVNGRWHAVARGVLRDELAAHQRTLAGQVLSMPGSTAEAKVARWMGRDDSSLRFTLSMLQELAAQKTLDYPTASVAVQRLGQLAAHGV